MPTIAEASVPGAAFSIAERKRRSEGGGKKKFVARTPKTTKAVAFAVLKKSGPEGMTLQEIVDESQRLRLRDWSECKQPKTTINVCVTSDPAFVKIAPGRVGLRINGAVPLDNLGNAQTLYNVGSQTQYSHEPQPPLTIPLNHRHFEPAQGLRLLGPAHGLHLGPAHHVRRWDELPSVDDWHVQWQSILRQLAQGIF